MDVDAREAGPAVALLHVTVRDNNMAAQPEAGLSSNRRQTSADHQESSRTF